MKKLINAIVVLFLSSNTFASEQRVYITGRLMETKMPSVNLLYYDIIKEDFCYLSTSKVSDKGDFLMTFTLAEPILCKFYEDFFFVTPGDTINIYIHDDSLSSKKYKLTIEGRNASHYEFSNFLKTKSSINIDKELNTYSGNWQEFQKICYRRYNEDIALLKSYTYKNIVSKNFYDYYKNNLFSDYLVNLLQPLYVSKDYDLLSLKNYFSSIQIDSLFKSEFLFKHQAFRQFCSDYAKFIIPEALGDLNTYEQILRLYNYINATYLNTIREYFLVFLYNRSLKIKSPETKEVVENIFTASLEFQDEFIRNYIKSKYTLYSNINKILPDSITKVKLFDLKGNNISLKKIIESFKGKYILIDNWATWCGPCLQEIAKAKSIQNSGVLKKDKIEILYLSQDKNISAWKQFSNRNAKQLKNSYIFSKNPNSFIQYFNITSIPRYILLNKEGELIDLAAPRISDYSNLLKLIK